MSLAIWDHTPATQHKRTHPALTPASEGWYSIYLPRRGRQHVASCCYFVIHWFHIQVCFYAVNVNNNQRLIGCRQITLHHVVSLRQHGFLVISNYEPGNFVCIYNDVKVTFAVVDVVRWMCDASDVGAVSYCHGPRRHVWSSGNQKRCTRRGNIIPRRCHVTFPATGKVSYQCFIVEQINENSDLWCLKLIVIWCLHGFKFRDVR